MLNSLRLLKDKLFSESSWSNQSRVKLFDGVFDGVTNGLGSAICATNNMESTIKDEIFGQ